MLQKSCLHAPNPGHALAKLQPQGIPGRTPRTSQLHATMACTTAPAQRDPAWRPPHGATTSRRWALLLGGAGVLAGIAAGPAAAPAAASLVQFPAEKLNNNYFLASHLSSPPCRCPTYSLLCGRANPHCLNPVHPLTSHLLHTLHPPPHSTPHSPLRCGRG